MSHIANALDLELKQAKTTAAAVARTSGLNEAQISRIRTGEQVWVSTENIISLAQGLQPAKTESFIKAHARLLYARLQDDCAGPGAKLIQISINDSINPHATNGGGRAEKLTLPPDIQRNLDTIASNITKNRNVRDMIASIAAICMPLPQAHDADALKNSGNCPTAALLPICGCCG